MSELQSASKMAEETPTADETALADQTPTVDETPTAAETPMADETPTAAETPMADETALADETPMADETEIDKLFKRIERLAYFGLYAEVYSCRGCTLDIALPQHLVKQNLKNRHAVFNKLSNIKQESYSEPTEKGRQIVCKVCDNYLGSEWFRENDRFVLKLTSLTLRKQREFFDTVTGKQLDRNMRYERELDMGMTDKDVYACKKCETPIALYHQWIRRIFTIYHYTLFGDLMNIRCEDDMIWSKHIWYGGQAVYCKTCGVELGYKVVKTTESVAELIPGRFFLFTDKLQLWKRGKLHDAATGEPYCKTEQTFIMIKPDGVQRGLVGKIIRKFEKKGLTLKGLKFTTVDRELAKKHYGHLSAKKLKALVKFIVSGPVVAMVWEGINAVFIARDIIGDTNPTEAALGTIRGNHAIDTTRNVIHGSDAVESAKKEIALWFPEGTSEWTSCAFSWINQ